jgi:DNA invertase Pin-like site-specific DNA recombinase
MKNAKRGRRLSPAEKETMFEMRRAKKTQKEIANALNVGLFTVKYHLQKAGFPTGRGSGFPTEQRHARIVPARKRKEILKRLERGDSVHSIARRLRVSRRFVWTVQRKHGIKSTYRGRTPLPVQRKIVAFPGSALAAARKYGVSGTTALDIRRRHKFGG